jgi:hypothetical protein
LPSEKLKQREVVHIDIANDPVTSADYKPDEDPTTFKSAKTGRGPLVGQWMDKVYRCASVTAGNMFQDLPQLHETAHNIKRYSHVTYINMAKFN